MSPLVESLRRLYVRGFVGKEKVMAMQLSDEEKAYILGE
jgi:hypothetical protein